MVIFTSFNIFTISLLSWASSLSELLLWAWHILCLAFLWEKSMHINHFQQSVLQPLWSVPVLTELWTATTFWISFPLFSLWGFKRIGWIKIEEGAARQQNDRITTPWRIPPPLFSAGLIRWGLLPPSCMCSTTVITGVVSLAPCGWVWPEALCLGTYKKE